MWDPNFPNGDQIWTPSLEGKVLTTGPSGKSPVLFNLMLRTVQTQAKGHPNANTRCGRGGLRETWKGLDTGRIQFSGSVVSDSLWPHESQNARPPQPSPTPGVHSNSCPLSLWCHPAISSSVVPFSSCPLSLPASGSFPMNQLLAWGGQSIGVSASASVLPMNTQDWSPLEWTGWISLQSQGLSRVFSNTTVQKLIFYSRLTSEEQK